MSMPEIKQKITVEEFHKLGEMGYFYPDARVELIEGEIVYMTPIGRWHNGIVNFLNDYFLSLLRGKIILGPQNSLILSEDTEFYPDIALLKYNPSFYADRTPTTEDVHLVIEVSDSSISRDRNRKVPLYAKAGVPEVWLIDVNKPRVEVYRDPQAGGYQSKQTLVHDELLSPTAFPEVQLKVNTIFSLSD
jgi:Uma2 family endonuclease